MGKRLVEAWEVLKMEMTMGLPKKVDWGAVVEDTCRHI